MEYIHKKEIFVILSLFWHAFEGEKNDVRIQDCSCKICIYECVMRGCLYILHIYFETPSLYFSVHKVHQTIAGTAYELKYKNIQSVPAHLKYIC